MWFVGLEPVPGLPVKGREARVIRLGSWSFIDPGEPARVSVGQGEGGAARRDGERGAGTAEARSARRRRSGAVRPAGAVGAGARSSGSGAQVARAGRRRGMRPGRPGGAARGVRLEFSGTSRRRGFESGARPLRRRARVPTRARAPVTHVPGADTVVGLRARVPSEPRPP